LVIYDEKRFGNFSFLSKEENKENSEKKNGKDNQNDCSLKSSHGTNPALFNKNAIEIEE